MTDQELNDIIKTLKAIPDGNDGMARTVLKAAADSITLAKIKELTDVKAETESNEIINESDGGSEMLVFSRKEIDSMPRTFRKQFRCKGITAHVHKRRSGKRNWNYEIRCQVNHQKINVSSNNLEEAKRKFIARLEEVEKGVATKSDNGVPTTMDAFSQYYFENFRKRKVAPNTYRITLNEYKNHIFPHFGDMPLKKITPKLCQELIDKVNGTGIARTAEDIFTLLNLIFKAAVSHGVIASNPMDMVFHEKHEREHGTALTKDEERKLLDSVKGTPQELMFAVALYTGLRPAEYQTATIDGDFIKARNLKRKGGKVEYKKIPITPMLKPYMKGVDKLEFSSVKTIRNQFNRTLPNHKLYDLRTTFYTRCTECGVKDVAIKKFAGHTLEGLAETYTDLSDSFLLAEGNKLCY